MDALSSSIYNQGCVCIPFLLLLVRYTSLTTLSDVGWERYCNSMWLVIKYDSPLAQHQPDIFVGILRKVMCKTLKLHSANYFFYYYYWCFWLIMLLILSPENLTTLLALYLSGINFFLSCLRNHPWHSCALTFMYSTHTISTATAIVALAAGRLLFLFLTHISLPSLYHSCFSHWLLLPMQCFIFAACSSLGLLLCLFLCVCVFILYREKPPPADFFFSFFSCECSLFLPLSLSSKH